MRSNNLLLAMWLALLALTACTPSVTARVQNSQPQAVNTSLPLATQTITAPRPTSTAPQPHTSICSPLAVQPLAKIGEIVTQPFIMPRSIDNGQYADDAHHGVDLGYYTRDGIPFTGTDVHSVMDGRIAGLVYDLPPYGNAILVETSYDQLSTTLHSRLEIAPGASIYTLYGHMQNMQDFELGNQVKCADLLAQTGLTGFTGGPHLHLETRFGPQGRIFDSMAYYRADLTPQEMENYRSWRMSGDFTLFDPLKLFQN